MAGIPLLVDTGDVSASQCPERTMKADPDVWAVRISLRRRPIDQEVRWRCTNEFPTIRKHHLGRRTEFHCITATDHRESQRCVMQPPYGFSRD